MYRLIFVCLCFLILGQAIGQGRVQGRVSDAEGPLGFVVVQLEGTSLGATTNENGEFIITGLQITDYQLVVQALGYEEWRQAIRLTAAKPTFEAEITLREPIIVVSGTARALSKMESPIAVDVYSAEYFRRNPAPSVFDALQNVNGVRPQLNCNICNTGDIHINGLEGPYTMVLIDGMPIVSGLSTVYGLTGIPQALIERVEVVKGPASTLYGSEAVGGLINVITKDLKYAPRVAVDVFATSWGEVNADLGGRFAAGKKAKALLGVNYFNYQAPIDNNGDGFTDVTLQHRISLFNKWNFERAERRIFNLAARYVAENRWGGQLGWHNGLRGGDSLYAESIRTQRWETFGSYQLPSQSFWLLQWSANGHYQNSYYGQMPFMAAQHIGFGQLSHQCEVGGHQVLAGAALRYTHYEDNTVATPQASVTVLPGVFVQDQWAINPVNTVLLGLRLDYNQQHGFIFSPRVNYRFLSKDKLNTLRVGIGNGYRVANVFTEDHAALTGAREVVFAERLRPETSWNINLNFVKKFYTRGNVYMSVDAGAFATYFGNRILPDYDSNPNQIIYSNLDGFATSHGANVNFDISLPFGLTGQVGATWIEVWLHENQEKTRPMLTERFSAVWSVSYELHRWGVKLDYTGNLYSPMRLPLLSSLDPRAPYSPWWSLQNLQITKKLYKNIELYCGVKNILNYCPPANSIARAHDPFDRQVVFGSDGQALPTANNPYALTFDPSYVFAPNQGRRLFLGLRASF